MLLNILQLVLVTTCFHASLACQPPIHARNADVDHPLLCGNTTTFMATTMRTVVLSSASLTPTADAGGKPAKVARKEGSTRRSESESRTTTAPATQVICSTSTWTTERTTKWKTWCTTRWTKPFTSTIPPQPATLSTITLDGATSTITPPSDDDVSTSESSQKSSVTPSSDLGDDEDSTSADPSENSGIMSEAAVATSTAAETTSTELLSTVTTSAETLPTAATTERTLETIEPTSEAVLAAATQSRKQAHFKDYAEKDVPSPVYVLVNGPPAEPTPPPQLGSKGGPGPGPGDEPGNNNDDNGPGSPPPPEFGPPRPPPPIPHWRGGDPIVTKTAARQPPPLWSPKPNTYSYPKTEDLTAMVVTSPGEFDKREDDD